MYTDYNRITITVSRETLAMLEDLLQAAKAEETMGPNATVKNLVTCAAETMAEGWRRPGSWEAGVVKSMFGV